MKRAPTQPTPWRLHTNVSGQKFIVDANDVVVAQPLTKRDWLSAMRTVRAVNAYESPVAKAERRVLALVKFWATMPGILPMEIEVAFNELKAARKQAGKR